MAERVGGGDSFTEVLRGPEISGERGSRERARADADATERFGWGAPSAVPGPAYGAGEPGEVRESEAPPEVILVRVRPHARRLTIPVVVLLGTVTAFGWFGGRFAEEWQNWAAVVVAGALMFFVVLLPFFAWLGHRYTITSRRIIARTGLLVRHRQDLYLSRVTDVRLRRTPLQAAYATGNVRVVAGPDLTVVLRDIPSAKLVTAMLGELTEHPTPTFIRPPVL